MDEFLNECFNDDFGVIENFIKDNFLINSNLQTYIDELKFYLNKLNRSKSANKDVGAVIEVIHDIISNVCATAYCNGFINGCDAKFNNIFKSDIYAIDLLKIL